MGKYNAYGQGIVLPTNVGVSGNSDVVYDDMQINVGRVRFPGPADPSWTSYNHGIGGGIAFDVLGFRKNDYIEFDVQTSHSMKLNTTFDVHMHFILPNTTTIGHKIVWQVDVIAAGIDGTYAVPTGSPFTATHTVAANDDTNHRLLGLANIPAVNTTVSTIYTIRLTRIDGTATEYASNAYVKYIDCHFRKDTLGSLTEGSKV